MQLTQKQLTQKKLTFKKLMEALEKPAISIHFFI